MLLLHLGLHLIPSPLGSLPVLGTGRQCKQGIESADVHATRANAVRMLTVAQLYTTQHRHSHAR